MEKRNGGTPRHPIRVVAKRTGLTPAVLRAWEKRYGVVVPSRTDGGQRLYSDMDVNRLILLRKAVEEGRNISSVAALSSDELMGLVAEDAERRMISGIPEPLTGFNAEQFLSRAETAVREMDPSVLERTLTRAAMALSIPAVTDDVVVPLLASIGESWHSGHLAPAQEHLASVVIRRFLEWLLATVEVGGGAPVLMSATPSGERHEFGALLASVTGAAEGWKSHHIGPDLPSEEIAKAALQLEAEVVALSVVETSVEASVFEEIQDLRGRLPADVYLFLGGPIAQKHADEWRGEGIEVLDDLEVLRSRLRNWTARG
jgi:DNA-binding transcriptional MerR regulator/methylmalonyl-CoA mutase cobalamin-binding subunit